MNLYQKRFTKQVNTLVLNVSVAIIWENNRTNKYNQF